MHEALPALHSDGEMTPKLGEGVPSRRKGVLLLAPPRRDTLPNGALGGERVGQTCERGFASLQAAGVSPHLRLVQGLPLSSEDSGALAQTG